MKLALMMLCAGLAGCVGTPVVRTERVDVPVSVPCHTPDVRPPVWATADLRPDAGFYDRMTALLAELEQRKGHEMRLEAALSSCQ